MKTNIKKLAKVALSAIVAFVGINMFSVSPAFAAGYSLTMAPMNQSVIIDPGDSYTTSFTISNAAASTQDTYYKIEVDPFSMNEKNEVVYTAEGQSGEIVNWVTFDVPEEGKLAPNEVKDVVFTINVPKNAPAGGQYLSVKVTASAKPEGADDEKESGGSGMTIKEVKQMSHLVYAEITGNTIKTGEFLESNVPSFILSGNITGSATVKNTGNVHQKVSYTLQVFPLFSGEEVYTNEENPTSYTVMPGRELLSEITWKETPAMGIFNVVFKGDFGGQHLEISKMVIKCPVWLLFLIIFIIAAIIIYFVARARRRSKANAD